MLTVVELGPSTRGDKKFMVRIAGRLTHFGQAGASDYTIHKNPRTKAAYVARHQVNERWGKRDIHTAGFWSRWLLWNLPTLAGSKRDIASRFGVKIVPMTRK